MAKSKHYYIRKSHRWLGLILGIQFLFWTIGGLYFSWSNIDEVHGDPMKKQTPLLSSNIPLISPSLVLHAIKQSHRFDSLISIQLVDVLGIAYYQIRGTNPHNIQVGHQHKLQVVTFLANASTGQLRGQLSKAEAIQVAKRVFNGSPIVTSITYLTSTDNHHEYRESPLPAYAVSFQHPTNTTVYVSTELGTVQKFRTNQWRTFDFLWMLHTMDYESRDNFGNWLLRGFSILGLFTILSGFLLFIYSSRSLKKWVRFIN